MCKNAQSVQNYCFSLLNMQIYDVLVAAVIGVLLYVISFARFWQVYCNSVGQL